MSKSYSDFTQSDFTGLGSLSAYCVTIYSFVHPKGKLRKIDTFNLPTAGTAIALWNAAQQKHPRKNLVVCTLIQTEKGGAHEEVKVHTRLSTHDKSNP